MTSQVKVIIRFRPLNKQENENGSSNCVELPNKAEIVVNNPYETSTKSGNPNLRFTFDDVLAQKSQQEDLFQIVGQPTIENVLKGYNGTILAYGQTGSGKTHSMLGPEGGTADCLLETSPYYHQRGLIPRIIEALFQRLSGLSPKEVTWKVTISIYELYREMIQDLLTAGPQQEYRIREDTISGKGIYVENLCAKQCKCASELLEAIKSSMSRRKIAATRSNETSSRSHCLTVVAVEIINHVQEDSVTVSRLNLVDLAGSEKVGKTQATGDRLKEAQLINLSLTLLGNVIYKLTDGKNGYIPYRNSKLTRLLQESFGGNSITTLLCHCSPAFFNREETISTLRFASRAKFIKNRPRVNRDLSLKELQLLYAQALDKIKMLEERVSILLTKGGTNLSLSRERSPVRSCIEDFNNTPEINNDQQKEGHDMQEALTNLLIEVEDLKKDIYEKDEDLAKTKEQLGFYKKKLEDAELENNELKSQHKHNDSLFQRRLLDLEAENQNLKLELEAYNASKNVQLIDNSATSRPNINSVSDIELKSLPCRTLNNEKSMFDDNFSKNHDRSGARIGNNSLNLDKVKVNGAQDVLQFKANENLNKIGNNINMVESLSLKVPVSPETTNFDAGQMTRDISESRSKILVKNKKNSNSDSNKNPNISSLGQCTTKSVESINVDMKSLNGDQKVIKPIMIDIGIMAQLGTSESEYLLKINGLEDNLKQLREKCKKMEKNEKNQAEQIAKIGNELEVARARQDELLQELDRLKNELESKTNENIMLKTILEQLNINIEEYMANLGTEQERNAFLKAEAEKLRKKAQTLIQTSEQQEYCEMASMEIIVKMEDLEAVENEAGYLCSAAASTSCIPAFLSSAESCKETISKLTEFFSSILNILKVRSFNTSNLESQRISLIKEISAILERADGVRAILDNSMNSVKDRQLIETLQPKFSLQSNGQFSKKNMENQPRGEPLNAVERPSNALTGKVISNRANGYNNSKNDGINNPKPNTFARPNDLLLNEDFSKIETTFNLQPPPRASISAGNNNNFINNNRNNLEQRRFKEYGEPMINPSNRYSSVNPQEHKNTESRDTTSYLQNINSTAQSNNTNREKLSNNQGRRGR